MLFRYAAALVCVVLTVVSWVASAEIVHRLESTKYDKPMFIMFTTHSSYASLIPLWAVCKAISSWQRGDGFTVRLNLPRGRELYKNMAFFVGIAYLAALCAYTWYLSVSLTSISGNTAVYNSSCVAVFIASVIFLGESITWKKIAAVLASVTGVVVVAFASATNDDSKDSKSADADLTVQEQILGYVLVVVSMVAWSLYEVVYKIKEIHDEEAATAAALAELNFHGMDRSDSEFDTIPRRVYSDDDDDDGDYGSGKGGGEPGVVGSYGAVNPSGIGTTGLDEGCEVGVTAEEEEQLEEEEDEGVVVAGGSNTLKSASSSGAPGNRNDSKSAAAAGRTGGRASRGVIPKASLSAHPYGLGGDDDVDDYPGRGAALNNGDLGGGDYTLGGYERPAIRPRHKPLKRTSSVRSATSTVVGTGAVAEQAAAGCAFAICIALANVLTVWPIVLIFNYTGVEIFQAPDSTQIFWLLLNGLADSLLNGGILMGIALSNPLFMSVGQLMSLPTSMLADFFIAHYILPPLAYVGILCIFTGFVVLNFEAYKESAEAEAAASVFGGDSGDESSSELIVDATTSLLDDSGNPVVVDF